ncbi:M16 family metallopeptidase [Nannocystis pusilla]|uniref:Insulinase family protein n=1 Tax=Nannocystis pusilla TaxID=889268 RepID=A0ABS7TKY8_9BACT|nr:insulinase family protein [Nannocystis pusilla]MBZ5708897.1 insulinase family protein [Nannocystis pusilla]
MVFVVACASNQSWRYTPPELPTEAPPVVAPRVERIGAGLLQVRRAGPTVAIGLALRTPRAMDPSLASFTLELVARGPDRAIEDALGEYGGALTATWLGDGALLLAEVDAAAWAPALATIAAAVRRPEFTPADVEVLRDERLAAIQRRDGDPARRGLHALVRRVAPGLDALGEARPTSRWSIEHVRRLHAQLLREGEPTLVIVGDPPRAELERAVAGLGGWGVAAAQSMAPAAPAQARGEVLVVPRPGLAQTAIAVGRAVDGADDLALELAAAVVGSALREVLRRERGATYGVSVTHTPARGGGLLAIETQVDAAATGASLRAMISQLKAVQGRFLTGEVLRLLGRAFQVERMLAHQRVVDVAAAVAQLHVSGRPDDALAAELRRLGAVRDDDIERALARWFEPAALQIVLVGDPATIRAQVEPLGLGPLKIVDDGP